jgi:hypothetical protein
MTIKCFYCKHRTATFRDHYAPVNGIKAPHPTPRDCWELPGD